MVICILVTPRLLLSILGMQSIMVDDAIYDMTIQILKRRRNSTSQASRKQSSGWALSRTKSHTPVIISKDYTILRRSSLNAAKDTFVIAPVLPPRSFVLLITGEEVHKGRGGKDGKENPRFECVH